MSRFDSFTIDELHTLATALTNTILKIEDRIKARDYTGLAMYAHTCKEDADTLLKEINVQIESKWFESKS